MNNNDGFIDALEDAVKMSRASIAIFGAPLALIASQRRFLAAIDSAFVSLIASVALILFSWGTALAWNGAARAHLLLTKVKLTNGGRTEGPGFQYLGYVEEMFETISEEGLVKLSRANRKALTYLLVSSYALLLFLLLTVVWETPV